VIWQALTVALADPEILPALLAAAVKAGTPLLYATLGGIIAERGGVLNLGIEGMMITGAFFGFLGAHLTGSPWAGILLAACSGGIAAALHAFFCIVLRGNQVVAGLALTMLGLGLADYLGTPYLGVSTAGFTACAIPMLENIPVLGTALFRQDILVYLSYPLPPLLWWLFRHTRWGLALRAAGENPAAVLAAGLPLWRIRWAAVLAGGGLAGIGGAYLSLAAIHIWVNNITAGRGWIAVALVIFAFWRPMRAWWGAYLFSGVMALQMNLQAQGTAVSSSLLLMLPYLLTLAAVCFSSAWGKGRAAPASLGVTLEPEE